MIKLRPLRENSWIGIAAPSSPFDRRRFKHGVHNLEKLGFRITYQSSIFDKEMYLAGNDRRRGRELAHWLEDSRIAALLFARGGYGCTPLLPTLNTRRISPKVVVGFSDVTVLLNYLWKACRLPSLYGPMVANQLRSPSNARRLWKALREPSFFRTQPLVARKNLGRKKGARGVLVGGCLSLVASTIGTPYEIETEGSLLFLEDVDEQAYAVDRLLTQLLLAGKLKRVRGIVLGTFAHMGNHFPSATRWAVENRLRSFPGPILWGVPFGHMREPRLIPLGGIGRIEGSRLIVEKGIFG